MRLELTRSCDHYPLKVACIPISPPALSVPRTGLEPARLATYAPETYASTNSATWAAASAARNRMLPCNMELLALPPFSKNNVARYFSRGRFLRKIKQNMCSAHSCKESGKRDSNSRPRPWQGRALPTELLPQSTKTFVRSMLSCVKRKSGCKSTTFFSDTQIFTAKKAFLCRFGLEVLC